MPISRPFARQQDGTPLMPHRIHQIRPAYDRTLFVLALLLYAAFAFSQLSLALQRSPSADDAMFLSVPKNWLNGYGWATSYSEKIPFNPDFTGPTALLLLSAPLIKLFGPQLWIAGVTGAGVNLVLLALCMQQCRQYWPSGGLAALALVIGCMTSLPGEFASLIGYYTGSLLFLLACLLAFNPCLTPLHRAVLTGILAGIGLQIKLLMLPAFCLLMLLLLLHVTSNRLASFRQVFLLFAIMLVPVLVMQGSWQWYRQHELTPYSDAFRQMYNQYGRDFFLYHGSGIGQWLDAGDRWQHVLRNIDRNLYYLEEMLTLHNLRNPWLGQEPADIHHVFGYLFIVLVTTTALHSIIGIVRNPGAWTGWFRAALSLAVLAYIAWFLLLAMAMSPGHLFFPMQWALWLGLLAVGTTPAIDNHRGKTILAAAALVACASWLTPPQPTNMQKPHAMLQAAQYLQKNRFDAPLAGCGYSGYPRHLEYLLYGSQNFADCLDLIEDHVTQDADGHYHWRSPLAFNIVFSLQSPGINSATGMVLNACKDNILYRNNEVQVLACRFEDLQDIRLDSLMQETRAHQRWYRTRLKP